MTFGAQFFDGATAQAHTVRVEFGDKTLEFSGEGISPTSWRYRDIIRHDAGATADVWLASKKQPAARLVIADPAAITVLRSYAPRLFHAAASLGGTLRHVGLLGILTIGLCAALYFTLPHIAENAVPFVPRSIEARIGESYLTSTLGVWPACRAPGDVAGQGALDRLVLRLAGDDYEQPLSIDIVEMPVENAFALPGGHIIVTHKLIEKAESADELAGVIAHELGHVVERHPMIGTLENLGLNAVTTLVTGGSNNMVTSSAAMLAALSYSRDLESRADTRGISMLTRARISPRGFAAFFERLEAAADDAAKDAHNNGGGFFSFALPTLLSSHPASPDRAALTRSHDIANATPALDPAEWASVKAMCGGDSPTERPNSGPQASPHRPATQRNGQAPYNP